MMATFDDTEALIKCIETRRRALDEALESKIGKDPDEWSLTVRKAARRLIEDAQPNLPPRPARPEEHPDCGEYTALCYTLAAELVRHYPERKSEERTSALALSRGFILDLWDMWWSRVGGINPGEESRNPASQLGEGGLNTGYIIDPMVIRSVFSTLDDDLARIFSDSAGHADEERLSRQGIWLLQRLHRTQFKLHERVVLYEFLRLRHWRTADRSVGLTHDSLDRIIRAARDSKTSLYNKGSKPMPVASERAFDDDLGATGEDAALILETLQVLRSAVLISDPNPPVTAERKEDRLSEIGPYLLKSAVQLGIGTSVRLGDKTEKLCDTDVTALLRRLAADSRVIRDLCAELLGYEFPSPSLFETHDMPASAGCDCWVSVIGRRQTGKTTFMRSLVAALMPDDDSEFDSTTKTDWTKSRARILSKDDFAQEGVKYEDIVKSEDMKNRLRDEMDDWNADNETRRGTAPESKTIAEISTPYMARLRFFDLAGENIFRYPYSQMDEETRKRLAARNPVATIYMHSIDLENGRSCDNDEHLYKSAVKDAFTKKGPVYIVFNKADKIRKLYKGDAQAEIDQFIGCKNLSDRSAERDDDFDPDGTVMPEGFFSTRRLGLPKEETVTFEGILDRIDKLPEIVRRPFFHDRIREDIKSVEGLIRALLAEGHRDIAFIYLVCTRDGRKTPKELSGIRQLWADLEERVLITTQKDRRNNLHELLDTIPKKRLKSARETYEAFEKIFELKDGETEALVDEGNLKELENVLENLEKPPSDFSATGVIQKGRLVINEVKAAVKAAESLKSGLDNCIRDFLPELGFCADHQVNEIQNIRDIPCELREEIEKYATDVIAKPTEEWLKEHQYTFDQGRMLELATSALLQVVTDHPSDRVSGVGNVTAINQKPGAFDFDSGASPSVNPGAGSPSGDRNKTFSTRKILKKVKGRSFLEALLDMNLSPNERTELAVAFYNFSSPEYARYPELILGSGDHDFYRTCVLNSEDQLADELQTFRREALGALNVLLTARHDLHELDLEVVVNLAMARVICSKLGENENLFSNPEQAVINIEKAAEELTSFSAKAEILADEIKNCRIISKTASILISIRNSQRRIFKSKAAIYAELSGVDGKGEVWERLDQMSYQNAVGMVSDSDADAIYRTIPRIEARAKLYKLLAGAMNKLKNKKQEQITKAADYIDGSRFGLDNELQTKLCLLHVYRMYLVNVYPLFYLVMAHWIADSASDERIEQSSDQLYLQNLKDGAGDVWRKFHAAFQSRVCANVPGAVTIGAPLGDTRGKWNEAEKARRDFVELLLSERKVKDSIWRHT